MPNEDGKHGSPATLTHLVGTGPASENGAVWDLSAGDRLGLRLVGDRVPPAAVQVGARPGGVEAALPDGRCVGLLAPEAAARVAPLLAAGRPLSATVTALLPRPKGGPPRVQLAIGRRRRAA